MNCRYVINGGAQKIPHGILPFVSLLHCAIAISLLCFSVSCNQKHRLKPIDPGFGKYIEGFTAGTVPKKSSIRIQLVYDAQLVHPLNEVVDKKLFEIRPALEGAAYWVDARTIEFRPEKHLEPGIDYEVSFQLGEVLDVPKQYARFDFEIRAIHPAFDMKPYALLCMGNDYMALTGKLLTADVEDNIAVEKILSGKIADQTVPIKWHHNSNGREHVFTVDSLPRNDAQKKLALEWNGKPIGADKTGEKQWEVPALGVFKVMAASAVQGTEGEEYISLQFSQPLSAQQQLEGLVEAEGLNYGVSYTLNGSEIKMYSENNLEGDYVVRVNDNIKDLVGNPLKKDYVASVFFEASKPAVTILGTGTILPNGGNKVLVPFEAVNLAAVDVQVVKLYRSFIPEFMRQAANGGNGVLRPIAKPMASATVRLDADPKLDLHHKNRFNIDLDKYIKPEPGTYYSVKLSFKPSYSVFPCNQGPMIDDRPSDNNGSGSRNETLDDDEAFWQGFDGNGYENYDWDYSQRDNPCSRSYYTGYNNRFVSRNILCTNIGITAKKGSDNQLFVATTDLITAKALGHVEIELLDYQQQSVAKGSTDGDGIAVIPLKRKPYLLVASQGDQRNYMVIGDGSSLLQSKFDIGGTDMTTGTKGFIFGERGVWRPGDTLFLGCIIEDKTGNLPSGHPVELTLLTPQGSLAKRMVVPNAEDGFNVFKVPTDASAPTGNWLCRVKVGGATFEKTIKIESIVPNHLKMALDFGGAVSFTKGIPATIDLSSQWLFGAPANGLRAKVEAQLYKHTSTFPGYESYCFESPIGEAYTTYGKSVFDGKLSADGKARFTFNIDTALSAPGVLSANFLMKVFEPGGNFSLDNISVPFHPYRSYCGLKLPEGKDWGFLESGKEHSFRMVSLTTEGRPLQGEGFEVELYKLQWRWWWDNDGSDLSYFKQDRYNKLVMKKTVPSVGGKGAFTPYFKKEDRGRYLIIVKDLHSGHTSGKTFYVDDEGWRSRGGNEAATAATMVALSTDKPKYAVGETITVSIPSPPGGRALVCVETGNKILKNDWIKTEAGQTKYSFRAEKGMAPNIYVDVSIVQPHAQTQNDLPIRTRGILPVLVEDPATVLAPTIKMADDVRSGAEVPVTVAESNGKPMTYILAIVDRGLLDLTHFKTPDPHASFYVKEALAIKSWDMYDQVIGAFGISLDRILTIGGDAGLLADKGGKANRFKPVVKFLGPFKLSGGSKQTHKIVLPTYMGAVRAMVIAASKGCYGHTEKEVTVKNPLMVAATLPRALSPLEEFDVPVTVFATEKNIRSASVQIQSNPFIEVAGKAQVNFDRPGEQTVYFKARVKKVTGVGTINVRAEGAGEKAGAETEIDVRNPNPVVVTATNATVRPGESYEQALDAIGDGKSDKVSVNFSSVPATGFGKRLGYLVNYPHGCLEQTVSAAFPQLFLDRFTEMSQAEKERAARYVNSAIAKLPGFKNRGDNDGFNYWPGLTMEKSDPWCTAYAAHFLVEASGQGYFVPSDLLAYSKSAIRSRANDWDGKGNSDIVQAYRLYVLALAKSPDMGGMNRLKENPKLPVEAQWRLAAAYALAGQRQVALSIAKPLPVVFSPPASREQVFGSDLMDKAMVLEALVAIGDDRAAPVFKDVAAVMSQDNWQSTQATAMALMAMGKHLGNTGHVAGYPLANLWINGKANALAPTAPSAQKNVPFENGKALFKIVNTGKTNLYVSIVNEGRPLGGSPLPQALNKSSVLETRTQFLGTDGKDMDPANLKQGTDFIAKVSVANIGHKGTLKQLALTQLFPSGWEIINTRLMEAEGAFASSPSDHLDIRDLKTLHYFSLKEGERRTYYVRLNAAYAGKYFWPGNYCESMYDNTVSGGTPGKWVSVKRE